MTARPTVELSRLREIAWSLWDPIGLRNIDGGWADDEYDSYLLRVVSLLSSGDHRDHAIAYLMRTESEDMGLGVRPGQRDRATAAVDAVSAYLSERSEDS